MLFRRPFHFPFSFLLFRGSGILPSRHQHEATSPPTPPTTKNGCEHNLSGFRSRNLVHRLFPVGLRHLRSLRLSAFIGQIIDKRARVVVNYTSLAATGLALSFGSAGPVSFLAGSRQGQYRALPWLRMAQPPVARIRKPLMFLSLRRRDARSSILAFWRCRRHASLKLVR